ncbi:MAG: hypothetical protein K2O39_00945, partial [Clostridiales bacterium]|nr:hypothetical protein [Clostridiales bacterium]
GVYLNTMGAAWFVSYSWYDKVDKSHKKWANVSTYKTRLSVYKRTQSYHTYWLKQIVSMNENNLDKNTIGLSGRRIIEMASELLRR